MDVSWETFPNDALVSASHNLRNRQISTSEHVTAHVPLVICDNIMSSLNAHRCFAFCKTLDCVLDACMQIHKARREVICMFVFKAFGDAGKLGVQGNFAPFLHSYY